MSSYQGGSRMPNVRRVLREARTLSQVGAAQIPLAWSLNSLHLVDS